MAIFLTFLIGLVGTFAVFYSTTHVFKSKQKIIWFLGKGAQNLEDEKEESEKKQWFWQTFFEGVFMTFAPFRVLAYAVFAFMVYLLHIKNLLHFPTLFTSILVALAVFVLAKIKTKDENDQ